MPRYTTTAQYSASVQLTPEQHRAVGSVLEATAVASLRLATGEGHVPPTVADALTLIRAWYAAQQLGLAVVVHPVASVTNVGD